MKACLMNEQHLPYPTSGPPPQLHNFHDIKRIGMTTCDQSAQSFKLYCKIAMFLGIQPHVTIDNSQGKVICCILPLTSLGIYLLLVLYGFMFGGRIHLESLGMLEGFDIVRFASQLIFLLHLYYSAANGTHTRAALVRQVTVTNRISSQTASKRISSKASTHREAIIFTLLTLAAHAWDSRVYGYQNTLTYMDMTFAYVIQAVLTILLCNLLRMIQTRCELLPVLLRNAVQENRSGSGQWKILLRYHECCCRVIYLFNKNFSMTLFLFMIQTLVNTLSSLLWILEGRSLVRDEEHLAENFCFYLLGLMPAKFEDIGSLVFYCKIATFLGVEPRIPIYGSQKTLVYIFPLISLCIYLLLVLYSFIFGGRMHEDGIVAFRFADMLHFFAQFSFLLYLYYVALRYFTKRRLLIEQIIMMNRMVNRGGAFEHMVKKLSWCIPEAFLVTFFTLAAQACGVRLYGHEIFKYMDMVFFSIIQPVVTMLLYNVLKVIQLRCELLTVLLIKIMQANHVTTPQWRMLRRYYEAFCNLIRLFNENFEMTVFLFMAHTFSSTLSSLLWPLERRSLGCDVESVLENSFFYLLGRAHIEGEITFQIIEKFYFALQVILLIYLYYSALRHCGKRTALVQQFTVIDGMLNKSGLAHLLSKSSSCLMEVVAATLLTLIGIAWDIRSYGSVSLSYIDMKLFSVIQSVIVLMMYKLLKMTQVKYEVLSVLLTVSIQENVSKRRPTVYQWNLLHMYLEGCCRLVTLFNENFGITMFLLMVATVANALNAVLWSFQTRYSTVYGGEDIAANCFFYLYGLGRAHVEGEVTFQITEKFHFALQVVLLFYLYYSALRHSGKRKALIQQFTVIDNMLSKRGLSHLLCKRSSCLMEVVAVTLLTLIATAWDIRSYGSMSLSFMDMKVFLVIQSVIVLKMYTLLKMTQLKYEVLSMLLTVSVQENLSKGRPSIYQWNLLRMYHKGCCRLVSLFNENFGITMFLLMIQTVANALNAVLWSFQTRYSTVYVGEDIAANCFFYLHGLIMEKLHFALKFIFLISIYYSALRHSRKRKALIQQFIVINEIISESGLAHFLSRSSSCLKEVLLVTILTLMAIAWEIRSYGSLSISYLDMKMFLIIHSVITLIMYKLLKMTQLKYEVLSELLTVTVQENASKDRTNMYQWNLLRTYHKGCCKLVNLFNKNFGITMFLLMVQTIANALNLVTWSCQTRYNLVYGGEGLAAICFFYLQSLSYASAIIMRCDKVVKEKEKFTKLCYLLQADENDEQTNEKLEEMAFYSEKHSPVFTAAGFFVVNRHYYSAFLAAVASYSIICIQFVVTKDMVTSMGNTEERSVIQVLVVSLFKLRTGSSNDTIKKKSELKYPQQRTPANERTRSLESLNLNGEPNSNERGRSQRTFVLNVNGAVRYLNIYKQPNERTLSESNRTRSNEFVRSFAII
nr:unnamed protein product [Callosobruchus analis]